MPCERYNTSDQMKRSFADKCVPKYNLGTMQNDAQ